MAMKVVRAIGQAFDVCHKLSLSYKTTQGSEEQNASSMESSPKTAEVVVNTQTKGSGSSSSISNTSSNNVSSSFNVTKVNEEDSEKLKKQLLDLSCITNVLKTIEGQMNVLSKKIERIEDNQNRLMNLMMKSNSPSTGSSSGVTNTPTVLSSNTDPAALVAQYASSFDDRSVQTVSSPSIISSSLTSSFSFPIHCNSLLGSNGTNFVPHQTRKLPSLLSFPPSSSPSSSNTRSFLDIPASVPTLVSLLNGFGRPGNINTNNKNTSTTSVNINDIDMSFLDKQYQLPSSLMLQSPEQSDALFSSGEKTLH